MPLVKVASIRKGEPFEVTPEDITLGAMKSLIRSEAAAKEAWKDHANADVLATMDALLPVMLKIAKRKDPSWEAKTTEDLEDGLTLQELRDFMQAVAAVMPAAVKEAPSSAPLA